jgi:hypothetical protein
MSVDFWSPALTFPAYLDDEPPLCLSTLYTPDGGLHLGPLVCIYFAGHPEATSDMRHAGGSAETPSFWTDAEAALSLVEFGPSARKTGPLCIECDSRPQTARGRCRVCAAAELAADDRDAESEAA